MGMRSTIEQITPQQLAAFIENPRAVYLHIWPNLGSNKSTDDLIVEGILARCTMAEALQEMVRNIEIAQQGLKGLEAYEVPAAAKAGMKAGLERGLAHWHKIQAKLQNATPELIESARQAKEAKAQRTEYSLEKDWHVLHYVLNGTAEGGKGPLADAVLGGKKFRRAFNNDCDPPRYLTAESVRAVAEALAGINSTELPAKLDPEDAMAKDIYLAETLSDPDEWSYLPQFFEEFRAFYTEAAQQGNAMLLYIS